MRGGADWVVFTNGLDASPNFGAPATKSSVTTTDEGQLAWFGSRGHRCRRCDTPMQARQDARYCSDACRAAAWRSTQKPPA